MKRVFPYKDRLERTGRKVVFSMINDIDFDSFMLCLDVSGVNTSATLDMWINYYFEKISGKIYVFQCKEAEEIVRTRYQDEKVVWISNHANSFESIRIELDRLNKDDIFIIFGGENLTTNDRKKSFANYDYNATTTGIHFQEDENWEKYSVEIDDIYNYYQNQVYGIITLCDVTNQSRKRVLHLLEKSKNMSISTIGEPDDNSVNIIMQEKFDDLVRSINGKSIEESLSIIHDEAEILSEDYINLAEAIAYYFKGVRTKSWTVPSPLLFISIFFIFFQYPLFIHKCICC